jgi:glycosyltransferase involved in cell wall biosynthesis
MTTLDILIPVYNEGESIVEVLSELRRHVRTPCRVLICYDHDEDTTLPALQRMGDAGFPVLLVKNQGRGVHRAVVTGFGASTAPAVVVFPADDTHNAGILDRMVEQFEAGCEIVSANRLGPGSRLVGYPKVKAFLMRSAAFTLHHLARVPNRDATNGFRLFSRRVLDTIQLESSRGFTFSLELLVKCHRLGWKIGEVEARWVQRVHGASRFRLLQWLPEYLVWYRYAFATTVLGASASTVPLKTPAMESIVQEA